MSTIKQIYCDYKMLFELIPNLYIVFTPDLHIVTANKAYLDALMVDINDIINRNVFEVFPARPNTDDEFTLNNLRESIAKVLKTRKDDTMPVLRYDVIHEDGTPEQRYWSSCNYPIFNDNGEIVYIVQRVEDVTGFILLKEQAREKKLADPKLQKMEAEVYIRAHEITQTNRNLEKENYTLSRMFEELQKLDELKMNFFANVSHELRTPLTLILGPLTTLIASDKFSADEHYNLQIIERNALLLLKQVNDILEISKLEADKVDLEYSDTNIPLLVQDLVSNFELFAKDNSITLLLHLPPAFYAEIDGAKIQRVLLNLLSNAFKFTPPGGKIEITAQQLDDSIILKVEDTGPGIPPDMKEAIFERFRQITDRNQRGGTGLGLAIAKEFVLRHQGSISVDNRSPLGASFKVVLPSKPSLKNNSKISKDDFLDSKQMKKFISAELSTYARTNSHTPSTKASHGALVLIVEDNIDMNNFLNRTLSEDYNTIVAYNGEEGLEKAIQYLPDLIISDVMMPKMGGQDMVQALFDNPSTKGIPVIMLTAKMDDPLKISLLEKGVQDYLAKPFSTEELSVKVNRLITERKKRIIEHEALIQKLTSSNQELKSFAYVASHDLKTPLRAIDNLSQWIEEDLSNVMDSNNKAYMNKLRTQVHLMEKLLDSVLEYTTIEYKLEQNSESTSSSQLINTVKSMLSTTADFSIKLLKPNYPLHLHIIRLQQVLYHLIQNAIKHNDKEKAIIEIDIQENADEYIFTIRDNGPGIDKQYHKKIFNMFYTVKPRPQTGNIGIGLALVKKIISLYGTKIVVESDPDKGSLFTFTWTKPSASTEKTDVQQLHA